MSAKSFVAHLKGEWSLERTTLENPEYDCKIIIGENGNMHFIHTPKSHQSKEINTRLQIIELKADKIMVASTNGELRIEGRLTSGGRLIFHNPDDSISVFCRVCEL